MSEMTRLLNAGQIVWLDADMANSGKVEVVRQTPLRKFTTVKDGSSEWDVMTYRLTPVEADNSFTAYDAKHGEFDQEVRGWQPK